MPMVQCSSRTSYQLHNDITHVIKLIRSIESSDPKLLVAIAKLETDETLKSDFEGVAAYILLHDPVANDETNSNKTEKCSMLDASVASMVGGRHQKDLHLHFYDFKEHKTLSVEDKTSLKEWRLSHPDEFGQSKKRVLDARQGNTKQSKRHKRNNYSNGVKYQIQSVTGKLSNVKLKELDGD